MPSGSAVLERSVRLPFPAETVFAWHARPGAFERLTPPWERVTLVERSGGIEDGGRVVVRVGAPFGIRWVARHRDYEPGRQFVDEQVEGPFSRWVHLHRVEPDGAGHSVLTDRIEYTPPLGPIGAVAAPAVIRPRLERLLTYRHEVLRGDLATHAAFADRPGSHRRDRRQRPHRTRPGAVSHHRRTHGGAHGRRRRAGADEAAWDWELGRIDAARLEGIDAVIHLAGANVGTRWTPDRKRRIRDSRGIGTRFLAEALASLTRRPAVLVSASAVGIYGNRGDEPLTESSPRRSRPWTSSPRWVGSGRRRPSRHAPRTSGSCSRASAWS